MSWPMVKLGEIFEIARGGSPRPIDNYITDDPNGLNWVMISDATSSDKVIYSTKKKIRHEGLKKTREVKVGDFILSNSMSFGRPYIMGTDGCIHDGWLLLRPHVKDFCTDFFYHYLGSNEVYAKFASLAAGATVKNLNADLVRNVEIPLPPLEEQKRIAGILDQADALRRLRARALEKLNTLGQAVFQEMFGENLATDDFLPLKKLTSKIGSGATPRGGDSAYKEEGIPLIRSMNVRHGFFDKKGLAYIDDNQADLLSNVVVKTNDVLLNITGASVARVARAPSDLDGARVNQHVAIIRLEGSILPEFLEAYLLMPKVQSELLRMAESGATRQAITKAQIESFSVPKLAMAKQKEFLQRKLEIASHEGFVGTQRDKFDALFASLQSAAFQSRL